MQWRKLIQRIQDDYQWVIFSSAGQKIWELIKHSLGRLKYKKITIKMESMQSEMRSC